MSLPKPPTEEDVIFYRAHGWWVSQSVLDKELIELLRFGVERYYADERDKDLFTNVPTDWKSEHGEVLRQNDYISLQIREVAEFVRHPQVPAMAAVLAGTSEIRLFHDQLLYKPSGTAAATTVGWHNDRSYWQTCTSDEMITAWIPLTDVTRDMGPLTVIDGSHLWASAEGLSTFRDPDAPLLQQLAKGSEARWRPHILEMEAGQLSFHHCRTIHGSGPNSSGRARVALAIHFQDATNRYRLHTNASGKRSMHMNDLFCRRDAAGLPDYTDPYVCPLLWPVTEP
jgi:ectoine hydroxylase-related dioxygenase (phytanoyl-CoA dioxygenase family)